jgi:hypothetical protein
MENIIMPNLNLLKKAVALLLAICFVLPLSQCTTKSSVGVEVVDNLYGFEHLPEGYHNILEGRFLEGITLIVLTLMIFFLPLLTLTLKTKIQALFNLIASAPALYILRYWVFYATQAQYGGIIAISCWVLLIVLHAYTLWIVYTKPKK